MGGDDSQKLLPWRGAYSSPGRSKPPAHCEINTLTQMPETPGSTMQLETRGAPLCLVLSGRGSATDGLGHSWKAQAGNFSRVPKMVAGSGMARPGCASRSGSDLTQ